MAFKLCWTLLFSISISSLSTTKKNDWERKIGVTLPPSRGGSAVVRLKPSAKSPEPNALDFHRRLCLTPGAGEDRGFVMPSCVSGRAQWIRGRRLVFAASLF